MDSALEGLEKFIVDKILIVSILILAFLAWQFDLHDEIIKGVLPILGTIFVGRWAFRMWLHYIQMDFISGITWVVLEIVPPRDVLRSPKAMELFITNALYQFSNKGGREEFWQGAVWFWFSLEIVSIDGQVHFYIRTPSRVKELIETQMYAQYPQAQVKLVEDYTLAVPELSEASGWKGWGCEFKLAKPSAYPIKTYVDFGLDKDPKEEFKVDPISPIVELFGSLQKGEQMWLQIVVTPSKAKFKTEGSWFKHHDWAEETKNEIKRLLIPYTNVRDNGSVEIRPPGFLENVTKAMSAKTTKLGFDTGIRAMYVARRESWNISNRRNIRLIFRQFSNPDSNMLERHNSTQGDAYGGIFMVSDEVLELLCNRMLGQYRDRSFFHDAMKEQLFNKKKIMWPLSPYFFPAFFVSETFVLNTEELATLWHFPGQILKVPTLERIESKEASPPTNLPM